jgi:hypothetical protein
MLTTGYMLQGRYRIVSRLGQGGMGAVYRAWDTRLSIPVAVKEMVPQPGLDTATMAELRQQFQQEATILARLTHTHLVRVTDFFEDAGNAYLVMDFVEGESLADRIAREGALSEKDVLTWANQLLSALDYCHGQGVLHRDIKPQNVIIRSDGRAVLVDFGLVKLWDPSDPHTRTAMRGMGTPEYAPPEQYETAAGHTSPSSDVYSLGATLYHALTGQAPATATLRMADPAQFVPIQRAAPGVTPGTGMAISKAMELVRSQRWQSAREMAAALSGRAPTAAPALARPAAPRREATKVMADARQSAPRAGRRFPVWVWALGVLGVLLACGVVLVVGGVLAQQSQQQAAASATTSARDTAVARDEATSAAEAALSTATAEGRAAATAQALATARAQAAALTAQAQAAATAYAEETATAEARLYGPLWEASGWSSALSDDFSAARYDWSIGDYSDSLVTGNKTIGSGVYRWEAKAFDDFVWWSVPDTDSAADCYVGVDVQLVNGVSNAQYGLIFRRVDSANYYLFLVSDNAYFEFVKVSEGAWTVFVKWTEAPAIQSGEVNRLEVVAKGSQFTFYINGEYVGEYSDSQFASGKPGLVVGLSKAGDTCVVEFDNFEFRVP